MVEYRLQGLSCPDCSQELERRIHGLPFGETAKIKYPSGKLKVDRRIDRREVETILASEGVQIVPASGEAEGATVQPHHLGFRVLGRIPWKVLLSVSVTLFVVALIIERLAVGSANGGVSTVLYLAAMVISGHQTFLKGLRNLSRLSFNMDTLMTIALIGAVAIGEWKEGAFVAILFGLNEYLEGLGLEKAHRSMEALLEMTPEEAIVLRDGKEIIVPVETLKVGDIVLVRAGDKIPSDGIVRDGKSSVSEAAITGESLPADKEPGSRVFGGSVNHEGVLKVEIERPYEDSTLVKILHMVEEAEDTRTPTELFINRFAQYYTPLIMVIAAMVIVIPPLLLGADWGKWVYQGLAVLIVGCPCALVLSSPIANLSGITRNARNGILVKGSVHLEQLGKIQIMAFDKTGTLTKGKPYVEETVVYDEERFFSIAKAVEKSSSHPLAQAILQEIGEKDELSLEPDEVETVPGQGVAAKIDGVTYTVGNVNSVSHLDLSERVQTDIERLREKGLTLVVVADEEDVLGLFGIADEIRAESRSVIARLRHLGIHRTVMLTGDHERAARKVARSVGITDYFNSLLPEEKVNRLKELAQQGKVAMVGDGINDAPALATADLGIAMGKGTDSAIETADIVLMQDHLEKLPDAVAVAKKVNRIVRLNIFLALGLKLFALLLTIPGWLTLWIAILSDMGATILVTLISLTVLWERKRSRHKKEAAHMLR